MYHSTALADGGAVRLLLLLLLRLAGAAGTAGTAVNPLFRFALLSGHVL
jgi:hypothetical protein